MQCWCVDNTLPKHMIVGLPPGWMDTNISRLYISINAPQPGGTWPYSRSPPITWWLKWCTGGSMDLLTGIQACNMTKITEPSCFSKKWNWQKRLWCDNSEHMISWTGADRTVAMPHLSSGKLLQLIEMRREQRREVSHYVRQRHRRQNVTNTRHDTHHFSRLQPTHMGVKDWVTSSTARGVAGHVFQRSRLPHPQPHPEEPTRFSSHATLLATTADTQRTQWLTDKLCNVTSWASPANDKNSKVLYYYYY